MFSLATLKHPAVRDLAYSCFGPDLIRQRQAIDADWPANCALALTPARQQWLEKLDQSPAALVDYLSDRHSTRLGIYFEYLWRFFIEQDPALTLVCHNLPVYQHKRTVGEFDLIYYCQHRQRHFHLELAIKFYMGWPSTMHQHGQQQTLWIGPNSRDRFDIKLSRLLQHQSQLGQTKAGMQALSALDIHQVTPELAVKGWLFYPANNKQIKAPTYSNSQHLRGHWLRLTTFKTAAEIKDKNWAIIDRARWLSPVFKQAAGEHSQIVTTLEAHFSQHAQSVMLAQLDQQGNELARYFVCNDQWPAGEVIGLDPHLI